MVKLFTFSHTYKHPWSHVTSAFWRKYPNPLAPHIRHVDCYDRSLDAETGTLTIRRLIAAEQKVPGFLASLGVPSNAYVMETTTANARTQELVLKSKNITGSSVMTIEETCTYKAHGTNNQWTSYTQEAQITAFLPMFSSHLESMSIDNFKSKSSSGLQTIEVLCGRIATEGLHSLHSLSDTFNAFVQHQTEKLGESAAVVNQTSA